MWIQFRARKVFDFLRNLFFCGRICFKDFVQIIIYSMCKVSRTDNIFRNQTTVFILTMSLFKKISKTKLVS